MKTWILVANSAEAKFLDTDNLRVKEPKLIQELFHPESRKKGLELMADKPGHYQTDNGARGAYSKSDPKETEAEHFAVELANELKLAWDQNKFKKLLIVVPAHFYGLLKKHLHLVGDLEMDYIAKDYTKYDLTELHEALNKHFFG